MKYVFVVKSIGVYTLPYKLVNKVVYSRGTFVVDSESAAVRGFIKKCVKIKSHMPSHRKRKEDLIGLVTEKYIDKYPEAFI